MLKKLKRKFIIINMLMVGIVILIVFAVVCIHTYTTEKNKVVDRLEQAIIIRENMVDYLPEIGTFGKKSNIGSEYIVSAITVQLDGDNQMFSKIEINATMSEEGLEKAVGTALAAEEDCGIISSMNIMYLRRTNARGIKIAFTDITEFQNSVKSAAVGGGPALRRRSCSHVCGKRYIIVARNKAGKRRLDKAKTIYSRRLA